MTSPAETLALAVTGAGAVALLAAGLRGGRWLAGLHMALKLWTAAELLQLGEYPTEARLAASAVLVVICEVAALGLDRAGRARAAAG